ncbi:uncharacterized protein LOC134527944 [Bacillus rossius redtenbacheri]|uniref:uncharacterized protein LOC134527944 n=1 Tax=Bacillus rossius redtenbacheri TaxID=93214 RepID=UPI002FDE09EF
MADTSANCLPNDQGTEQDEPQPTVELVDEDPSPEGAPLRCHPCGDDPGTVTITELPYSPGDPEMDSDPGMIPLVTEPEEEDAENHETPRNSPPGIPEREVTPPASDHDGPAESQGTSRPTTWGTLRVSGLITLSPKGPKHFTMRRAAAPGPAASAVDRAACATPPFHAPCRCPRPSCLRSRPGGVHRATLPCAVPPPPAQLPPQSTGRRAPRHPTAERHDAAGNRAGPTSCSRG